VRMKKGWRRHRRFKKLWTPERKKQYSEMMKKNWKKRMFFCLFGIPVFKRKNIKSKRGA